MGCASRLTEGASGALWLPASKQAGRLQPGSDSPLINSARNDVGIPIAPRNLMRDDLFFQKCSDLLF